MNVIRVMGGLGNQLFQYAFGKAQMLNGIDVCFTPPTPEEIKRNKRRQQWPRPYNLNKFQVDLKHSDFLKQEIVHEAEYGIGFAGLRKLELGHPDMSLLKRDNCNFEGYWQWPTYFQDFLPLLRKEFCVKEEFYTKEFLEFKEQIVNDPVSVSVHVRRGDYVLQRGFHDLQFSYYFEALSFTKGNIYIFSDDIPWCKEKFKEDYFDRKITFIELEDYLDFELMRSCKHHVAANSTFSYMVGLLSDDPDSIIVVPSGWITGARELGDKELMKKADDKYYLKEWVKI